MTGRVKRLKSPPSAGIAQLVERNLAKVEVASSNLVSRSKLEKGRSLNGLFFRRSDYRRLAMNKTTTLFSLLVFGLVVSACSKEQAEEVVEEVTEAAEEVVEDVADATEEAMEEAAEVAEEVAEEAAELAEEVAEDVSEAVDEAVNGR